MKLACIESVIMKEDGNDQAFTEGKEYRARRGNVKGLNGNPYETVQVLTAKNDKGESHIIRNFGDGSLETFYTKHFKELQ